jgi:hypothetical protein
MAVPMLRGWACPNPATAGRAEPELTQAGRAEPELTQAGRAEPELTQAGRAKGLAGRVALSYWPDLHSNKVGMVCSITVSFTVQTMEEGKNGEAKTRNLGPM